VRRTLARRSTSSSDRVLKPRVNLEPQRERLVYGSSITPHRLRLRPSATVDQSPWGCRGAAAGNKAPVIGQGALDDKRLRFKSAALARPRVASVTRAPSAACRRMEIATATESSGQHNARSGIYLRAPADDTPRGHASRMRVRARYRVKFGSALAQARRSIYRGECRHMRRSWLLVVGAAAAQPIDYEDRTTKSRVSELSVGSTRFQPARMRDYATPPSRMASTLSRPRARTITARVPACGRGSMVSCGFCPRRDISRQRSRHVPPLHWRGNVNQHTTECRTRIAKERHAPGVSGVP
jgi:hypothetical protein